jgi:hypothetical protein
MADYDWFDRGCEYKVPEHLSWGFRQDVAQDALICPICHAYVRSGNFYGVVPWIRHRDWHVQTNCEVWPVVPGAS